MQDPTADLRVLQSINHHVQNISQSDSNLNAHGKLVIKDVTHQQQHKEKVHSFTDCTYIQVWKSRSTNIP